MMIQEPDYRYHRPPTEDPDPNCPDCRGTGRIELVNSSEPCDCAARAAESAPIEYRMVSFAPQYVIDWKGMTEAYRRLGIEPFK